MDFNYNDQQQAIRRLVREFTEKEITPGAEERDRIGEFDYALYRKLGDLGVMGMQFPGEYGGSEHDFLSYCLAIEEISRADVSLAASTWVSVATAQQIVRFGTKEQKERWKNMYVVPVVQGAATTAGAITEPGAGSDTRAARTTAVLDGDEWVINGSKMFITNAGLDNNLFVNVLCITDKPTLEFSYILVPTGTPGYTIMPKLRKIGFRSSSTHELAFDDCRVPAFNLMGGRGIGRRIFVDTMIAEGRLTISSGALGIAVACFEQALAYAKQRIAFKRPITKFQFVQGMLVDMALELETSRMLRDKAALTVDEGSVDMKLSAMAKYFCCESAKRAADYAIQIHGGMGLMDECPVSRYYRDARVTTIPDGTTEIMKWIIAREIGC